MGLYSPGKVIGDTGVEGAVAAFDDVDVPGHKLKSGGIYSVVDFAAALGWYIFLSRVCLLSRWGFL